LDDALRRYRKARFSDRDITHCTGLSQRAWRELISMRAVRTVTEARGRGVVRLCNATVFKRAAVIGVLNRAGLNLAVSGQMAYFLPFHTALYEICDPCTILLPSSAAVDPETGLPPPVKEPTAVWFAPDKPAKAEPESDWVLEIYEGRFVGAIYDAQEEPTMFGDLREKGASFVAWFPFRRRGRRWGTAVDAFLKRRPLRMMDFVAQWEEPTRWPKELKSLGYKYEKHNREDDHLCKTAEHAAQSPVFKTRINITLAIRIALRKYLGIEPSGRSFGM
jgi:hypothetical protein